MDISKLSDNALYVVLAYGFKPIKPYSMQDYRDEWNKRCKKVTNKDVDVKERRLLSVRRRNDRND